MGLLAANASGSVRWFPDESDLSVLVVNPDGKGKMVSVLVAPFASYMAIAASGSVIWRGNTAVNSLMRLDAQTNKRITVRLHAEPVALSAGTVEAARRQELANARTQPEREEIATRYRANNLPKTLPAFGELLPGYGDELWVQLFEADPAKPGHFVVLAGSGVPVSRITVPPRFYVTDVGRDFVIGVHRDADGVESVQGYALSR